MWLRGWRERERAREREITGYEASREAQTVVAGEVGACSLPEVGQACEEGGGDAPPSSCQPHNRSTLGDIRLWVGPRLENLLSTWDLTSQNTGKDDESCAFLKKSPLMHCYAGNFSLHTARHLVISSSSTVYMFYNALEVMRSGCPLCEDRVLDGPASGGRAPRVGIGSTVFGVRA